MTKKKQSVTTMWSDGNYQDMKKTAEVYQHNFTKEVEISEHLRKALAEADAVIDGQKLALDQVGQQRDEAISKLHSVQRELQFTKESAKAREVAESVVPKLVAELNTTRDALRAINTLWLLKDAQSEKTGI